MNDVLLDGRAPAQRRPLRAILVSLLTIAVLATVLVLDDIPDGAAAGTTVGARAGFSPGAPILWGSDEDLARELDGMAASGARWLRVDFDWPSVQPRQDVWNWSHTDRVVTAARARGLEVLALPVYTPGWARPANTSGKHPPTDPALFANFVREAVRRYAPQGVWAWEIWNEPNLAQFWAPKPDPAAYTRLLQLSAAAVRSVDPNATVITGGLSPATDASDGTRISPITYTQRMYAAGAKGHFDAVGIHPYSFPAMPSDPSTASWNTFYRTPLVHEIMAANGDGAKKIWLTEFGAPTGTGTGAVDEDTQAAIVADGFRLAESWSWAGPLFFYGYRDHGWDTADRDQSFGLVRPDFSAKRALATFKDVMRLPSGHDAPAPTTTTVAPTTPTTAPAGSPTTTAPKSGVPKKANRKTTYYRVGQDGSVAVGADQVPFPDLPSLGLGAWIRSAAATPDGEGMWLTTPEGRIFALGGARDLGSLRVPLNKPVLGIAATPSGGGYWLVAGDGGVFSFGDAAFYGSTGGMRLNKPVVGVGATPVGRGYWLVASDGGIFAFGDAGFYGSTGSLVLNKPIVGMAATPSGRGYWLVASDGGIFAYGDAGFYGSTGGMRLDHPIIGMATTESGRGYWMMTSAGEVFAFGDAALDGSGIRTGTAGAALTTASVVDS